MSKNNILVKITGSIAAYKSAYLISGLVQRGFNVKTVVTPSSLNFIGKATLEGLTGNRVYSDSFEDGTMMSHIDLAKWADLTIIAPADANTINKLASGIADNLLTSLFLAHDMNKPYIISPAMNTTMYEHPTTRKSLSLLKSWGIYILPTDEGRLACGDEGKGKLLDPEEILTHVIRILNKKNAPKKILITSGGTKEKIDTVRYISNMSTGRTGSVIADYLFMRGHHITFVKSKDSLSPSNSDETKIYENFEDLNQILKEELGKHKFDAIIHLAAISDYSPEKIIFTDSFLKLPLTEKLNSKNESLTIRLNRNQKIINKIKTWSLNEKIKLIGFKLVDDNLNNTEKELILNKMFSEAKTDLIVYNSLLDRNTDAQTNFELINMNGNVTISINAIDLAKSLEKFLED